MKTSPSMKTTFLKVLLCSWAGIACAACLETSAAAQGQTDSTGPGLEFSSAAYARPLDNYTSMEPVFQ